MAGRQANSAAGHFGRQMKKERLARGWSILELAQRMEVDAAHLGRVESGKRPPTENLAAKCDAAFPERRGWFTEFYDESRDWPEVPATFKSWPEYEDKATSLRVWSPSIIHGLLQTPAYARALICVQPHIAQQTADERLASRMERQQRVIGRDIPPAAWFIIDELSLYRQVGTPQEMAAQLRRILQVAASPKITVQVLPAVAHPVNASGFLLADDAAWVEHAAAGFVYTEREIISALALRFDTLRGECYRVSESAALLERLEGIWKAGASPLTPTATAGTA
jgi:transcriptional regulator with XRE-family HTH domain